MSTIEPLPVHISDDDLADLHDRLDRVRLPEPETDASQGIGLDRLTSLLDTWRRHDWRALERRWNAVPHFRSRLDGLDVAFWHVRSPEPTALPLVLTHGWPGSVLEFEDVIGPLTDPVVHGGSAADAFHLVVPALPGFGSSERPREQGWNPMRWGTHDAEEQNAQPVTVPTACTLFPAEPFPVARRWAERRYRNLISWNEMDHGGHYPGWEHPDLLVTELRNARG